MGSEYDSVLKEKKKYEEVIDDRHFLRKHVFGINFLVVVIILIISFIIYFTTMLSPVKMIYDDIIDFFASNDVIYKNILLDSNFEGNYNFSGNVAFSLDSNYDNKEIVSFLDDLNLEYSYLDNGNSRSLDIISDEYSFNYYEDNENGYLDFDNNFIRYDLFEFNYYMEDYENIFSEISDLFYQELEKLQLRRSVFVSDEKLVVSVDVSLDGSYVNEMYTRIISGLEDNGRVLPDVFKIDKLVSDSATYQINIKNDIFRNDIVNLKVIVNEDDYRGVLTYEGNTFIYKDDNNEYKCVLKVTDEDFSLRFYNGDTMKYILSGKGNDSSYVYTYQVINVVDNMSLQIGKDNNKNDYTLNIKKENGDKYLDLLVSASLNYNNYVTIDKDIKNDTYTLYDDLESNKKKEVDNYIYRLYNYLSNLFGFVK